MPPRDKNNPATTFYWKDHESDEGLRACSLAAQGLWMRFLCLAARAEPVGNITINGRPVTPEVAARIGGTTPEDAARLMQELEDNGVFSRDRSGTALLRKSAEGRSIPSRGQTYPARCVIGVPRAVKRFRIAALI